MLVVSDMERLGQTCSGATIVDVDEAVRSSCIAVACPSHLTETAAVVSSWIASMVVRAASWSVDRDSGDGVVEDAVLPLLAGRRPWAVEAELGKLRMLASLLDRLCVSRIPEVESGFNRCPDDGRDSRDCTAAPIFRTPHLASWRVY